MKHCLALLLCRYLPLLCLPTIALAQTASPPIADSNTTTESGTGAANTDATPASTSATETDPARQALEAWLVAFNANDRAQLEAFHERYQPRMGVDDMLDFYRRTGGFALLRHESSERGTAQVIVQERDSDTVARLRIALTEGEPLALSAEIIERPADLRIPRLDQDAAIAALLAKANAEAERDAFAGVLQITRGDDVLLQRAWGLADRASGTANTLDTKFRVGSINKMFTAVATLQLVQAGKLSLDAHIGQYLPNYPNADIAKVTVRQLLTHTGGTGDVFGPEFDKHRLSLKTHDDYLRLFGARGPDVPPGTTPRYSNYGFVLLGALIERVSGQSYYDYIDEHVFAPADMHDSGSLPESVPVAGRATGYTRTDDSAPWTDAADTLPWRGSADGGGYSTADDLLKFARALQSGKLLPPALLAEATRQQIPRYGFGFAVADEEEGVPVYGHGGGAQGMNAELRVFPTLGVVIVGLGNVDPEAVSRLVEFYQTRMPLAK